MLLQAFGLIAGAVFLFIMGGSKTLWVLYLSFAPVILGAMKQSLGSLSATVPVLGIIWVVCGVLMIIVSQTSYQKDYDKINKA